jgi:SAM-dependent methyltransferase
MNSTTNNTTGWTKAFYSRELWGPSGVLSHHRERATQIERLCGPGKKRILELGAGSGGTAAALADLGHDVTAVDIAPTRVANARALAEEPRPGTLTVLEADFFEVEFDGKFDIVAYWNGFGIGSDSDQRRLLSRIGSLWLAENGSIFLDVFHPASWLRIAGRQQRVETERAGVCTKNNNFDPIGGRFLDSWISEDDPTRQVYTQSIRCYTPADLLLLLEGTKLAVKYAEVSGQPFLIQATDATIEAPLGQAWDYLVQLVTMSETKGSDKENTTD